MLNLFYAFETFRISRSTPACFNTTHLGPLLVEPLYYTKIILIQFTLAYTQDSPSYSSLDVEEMAFSEAEWRVLLLVGLILGVIVGGLLLLLKRTRHNLTQLRQNYIDRETGLVNRQQSEAKLKQIQLELEAQIMAQAAALKQAAEHLETEVGERRQVESSLRQSEERFRATFERAAVGLAQVAPDGRWLRVNQKLCDILGYTRSVLLTLTFQDITHPDDLELDLVYVQQMLAGEIETYTMNKRYFRADGVLIWVDLTVSLMRQVSGEPDYFIAVINDITDLKNAELAVQKSEARYRSLFERAKDAIFLNRQDDQIVDANPSACRLLGYSRAELITMKVTDLQAPEVRGQLGTVIHQELKQNDNYFETIDIDRLGRRIPVEVSTSRLGDEPDSLVLSIVRDITERKQAEEAMQRYADRLRVLNEIDKAILAAQSAKDIAQVTLMNLQQLVAYQRASISLFDLETNEGLILVEQIDNIQSEGRHFSLEPLRPLLEDVGKHRTQVITEAILPTIMPALIHRLEAQGMLSFLSAPLISDGKLIGALSLLSPLPHAFTTEHQQIVREIADQIAVAIQNAQLADRFRQVITSISDYIYMIEIDDQGHYQSRYVSPQVEDLTGYSPEMFLTDWNRWLMKVVHAEDRDVARWQWQQLRAGQTSEMQYRVVRADGTVIWVRDNIRVEAAERGQVVYGVVSDLTEHRQLEDQLHQAQKMDAIGQLAGGIAHDFNNVLTVITGLGEIILSQHQADTDPLFKDIRQIIAAGHRAAALTRQLLAFSRKQVLQPEVIDLNSSVQNLEKMLYRLIGEDINLITKLEPELGLVKIDPIQVDQIIVNLAVNARDAMPQGGRLIIETANIDLEEAYATQHLGVTTGRYVMLIVSDSGHGMDEQTKARIFEPFFSTKERGKGTGLGLSTVHGIVNQSGGHIWVYSEPGQGTTFKIYLPQIDEPPPPFVSTDITTDHKRGTETILLVEDDPLLQTLVLRILKEDGYTVLAARHGQEAIEQARHTTAHIHLLITDVILPGGMNGREIAEELTKLRPALKILYISGYTDSIIVHHGVLSPDKEFLEKPFTPTTLRRKVREILDANMALYNQ
ncbi:MAG: PAS domain S-box protein [Anaerolineaceae bacterium]|nr:PAS domain S-box protein [Anaerolineaceae bacterium]